jgi:hypothetical protein
MKSKVIFIFSFLLVFGIYAQEDNPFSSIDKKGKILTLSNGKYNEIHVYDSLQRIGSVIINRNTGKIYQLLDSNSLFNESDFDPTVTSRFYAVDPLASEYPRNSPYAFSENRAIDGVELEGLEYANVNGTLNYDSQVGLSPLSINPTSNELNERAASRTLLGLNSSGTKVLNKPKSKPKSTPVETKSYGSIYSSGPNPLNMHTGGATSSGLFDPVFELGESELTSMGMSQTSASNTMTVASLGLIFISGKPRMGGNLGTGRTQVKSWLQSAGSLERSQLIKDIEGAGFKNVFEGKGMMHFERGSLKIRLDPPDLKTPFNHMHLNYGGNKNSFNIMLNPVNYKSSEAHIPIK